MADGFLSADAAGRAKMADGFLSADAAGRAKMADLFITTLKLANGVLSADADGLAKMADGFFSATTAALAKFADGFLSATPAGRAKMSDGYVIEAKLADSAVTPAKLSQPLTLMTAKAYNWNGATTNTFIEFTGIPVWAKRITVMFSGVSTNLTSNMLLQLGAGAVASSGYTSQAVQTVGTANNATSASGLILTGALSASALYSGCIQVVTLGSSVWASSGALGSGAAGNINYSCGTVTLSGTLDRIRITTVNGTDTFDAGSINILYEG